MTVFSWRRLWAVARKELMQMRRDRLTFAMMVGVPLIQLVLFGFAINSDPKHLPTAVIGTDASAYTRSLVSALQNSQYFEIVATPGSVGEATRLLELGKVQFVVHIPAGFSRARLCCKRGSKASAIHPNPPGSASRPSNDDRHWLPRRGGFSAKASCQSYRSGCRTARAAIICLPDFVTIGGLSACGSSEPRPRRRPTSCGSMKLRPRLRPHGSCADFAATWRRSASKMSIRCSIKRGAT